MHGLLSHTGECITERTQPEANGSLCAVCWRDKDMVKVFDGFHNILINIFNVFINSKPVYPYLLICYLSYNQTNNQGCYI